MNTRKLVPAMAIIAIITLSLTACDNGNKDTPVSVTGVSLSETALTLDETDTETLTATVEPADATNKAITWTTSDNTVASVSQTGEITANAFGTATITVTTADGNKTATCTVSVRGVPTPTSEPLSFGTLTVSVYGTGDEYKYITAEWEALIGSLATALEDAYEVAEIPSDFDTAFGGSGAEIVLQNDLDKNWSTVSSGTGKAKLYIKTGSISFITTTGYGLAVECVAFDHTAKSVN